MRQNIPGANFWTGSTAMNHQNQGMRNLVGNTNNYDPRYAGNMYQNNYSGLQPYQLMNQNMFNFSGVHQQELVRQQTQQLELQHNSGMVKDLRTTNLPFYYPEKIYLELQELPAQIGLTRSIDTKRMFNFYIPRDDLSKFVYRNEPVKLPRYEIQLRMFQLELDGEQPDAFPPGCQVYLDDSPVALPSIIPTNKPNAEQKRLSRPVNLTPYVMNPSPRADRPYRINVQWQVDKRGWALGVWLVNRVNTEMLQERMLIDPAKKRAYAVTKRNIVRKLQGEDEDIRMDTIRVSLIDPLVKTRIKIPSRSADCEHTQCFDLTNFLMMNEKRPSWKCAICDKNAHYSKLIIDEYFEKLLSDVPPGTDEVELLKDGSWRLSVDECNMLSDSDTEMAAVKLESLAAKPAQSTGSATVSAPTIKKPDSKMEPEIVTLSDSDKDDEPSPKRSTSSQQPSCAASTSNSLLLPQPKQPSLNDSHSSDDSVIFLDDDQPVPSPPQPSTAPPSVSNNARSTPQPHGNNGTKNQTDSGASTPSMVNNNIPPVSSWLPNGGIVKPSTPVSSSINPFQFQPQSSQPAMSPQMLPSSPQLLQTNGFHSGMYRPAIKEAAELVIAAELSQFLANIFQKNVSAAQYPM